MHLSFSFRACLVLAGGALLAIGSGQTAKLDPTDLKIPFDHYTCQDRFHRTIDFYLSKSKKDSRLPLTVMITGSGGQSIWTKVGDKVYGSLQSMLLGCVQGRFRVLAVEKPGVAFGVKLEQPGTAVGASRKFLEEHTFERWTEAVDASIRACHRLKSIDSKRTLVIGHSEGGIIAAGVAAIDPQITDVAVLAGGGPSQIFDFFTFMGREETLKTLAEIRKDPMSVDKFAWGHPYRRWSTFLATSPLEEALKSKARFYIAQGTADKNSYPPSADVLYAGLLGHGRDVQMDLVEDGDHGFQTPKSGPQPKPFMDLFNRILQWFTPSTMERGL